MNASDALAGGFDAAFRNLRRRAICADATRIGLDYIDAVPEKAQHWRLVLHFVPGADVKKSAIPAPSLNPRTNILITDASGKLASNFQVIGVAVSNQQGCLDVEVLFDPGVSQGASAFATYTLRLVGIDALDPFFAGADFSLRADLPGDLDPLPTTQPAQPVMDEPAIDYLARDFGSYRQLLLNRMTLLMPDWKEQHAADVGQAVIEILAYAADHLSYYQDAVATEAYLGTARQRVSLRRHARLVDYAVHEGSNARVWVQVQVTGGDPLTLPAGTALASKFGNSPVISQADYELAVSGAAQAFETLHPVTLTPAHNELHFYTWGARNYVLPQGATRAALLDEALDLHTGDVLILEQVRDSVTGREVDANPAWRQAVRLIEVTRSSDPLGGRLLDGNTRELKLVEIAWDPADALLFPLLITVSQAGGESGPVSVARGNIVLADHGRTIEEELPPPPQAGRYQPALRQPNLTFRVAFDETTALLPASAAISQDPRSAGPALQLTELDAAGKPLAGDAVWLPRRDLLRSDRFAREFVVETQNDGLALLRFGDGSRGLRPVAGVRLRAFYRTGSGVSGNVGAESLAHLVTDDPALAARIAGIRNPLTALGGVAPEPLEQIRQTAPSAFRVQERCVTTADYATLGMRHPQVRQAAAELRWTGSWATAFVSVTRRDGEPLDDSFRDALRAYLEAYRTAGIDVEVRAPRYIALDISLPVTVSPLAFRSTVRQALRQVFSAADLPDGRRGFFHPENFGFGQPVYLSQVLTAVMRVPGVARVDFSTTDAAVAGPAALRFKRWGRTDEGELRNGLISVGPLEIIRLDNNAAAPENGVIEFVLLGGR